LNADYANLGTVLDFSAWDNYPLYGAGNGNYGSAAWAHDRIRNTKKQNFIVMEQQGGIGGIAQGGEEGSFKYFVPC
jgi:hypothetical protein